MKRHRSKASIIIGIDPGLYGAIAAIRLADRSLIEVVDAPASAGSRDMDVVAMEQVLVNMAGMGAVVVYIEKQGPFALDSRKSVFTTGVRYGYWIALLRSLCIEYIEVPPKTWQSVTGVSWHRSNSRAVDSKEASLKLARANFPDVIFAGKDGRSDAALIAMYGAMREEK